MKYSMRKKLHTFIGIVTVIVMTCIPNRALALEPATLAEVTKTENTQMENKTQTISDMTLPESLDVKTEEQENKEKFVQTISDATLSESLDVKTEEHENKEKFIQPISDATLSESLDVKTEEQENKEKFVQTKIEGNVGEETTYVPVIGESEHMKKEREAAEQKAIEEEQKRQEELAEQERIDKALSEPATAETSIVGVPDPNPERIDKCLDGELSGKGQVFVDAGTLYNIDPMFIAAVAMHETGNGTSDAVITKNNVGGIMTVNEDGSTSLRTYNSVDESIYALAELLSKYVSNGLDTIAEIQPVYCPVGAENDPNGINHHWIDGVLYYWNELRSA